MEKVIKKILSQYIENVSLLDSVEDDTDLRNELNIDSVDVVEIIVDLEDEFNIKIEDSEMININTYGNLVDAIKGKLNIS